MIDDREVARREQEAAFDARQLVEEIGIVTTTGRLPVETMLAAIRRVRGLPEVQPQQRGAGIPPSGGGSDLHANAKSPTTRNLFAHKKVPGSTRIEAMRG